jgi:hypothetical protein
MPATDHKFDPIPTRDYYSLASIFASTKSLAKVEGTVSQLYFAPLVSKEVADRYNAHQEKVKAKQEDIDEVTGAEAERYAAVLRAQMKRYLPAAWQYENRPGSMADLKLADFARQQTLDAVVLERWIMYLKPSIDVRPHLKRWYEATDAATVALSRSESLQKLPSRTLLKWLGLSKRSCRLWLWRGTRPSKRTRRKSRRRAGSECRRRSGLVSTWQGSAS